MEPIEKIVNAFNQIDIKVAPNNRREVMFAKNFENKWEVSVPISIVDFCTEPKPRLTSDICDTLAHELGHWLVAPPGRRFRTNFGIPNKAWPPNGYDKWELEEGKATVAGLYCMNQIGFHHELKATGNIRRIKQEVETWWNNGGQDFIASELKKAGIKF